RQIREIATTMMKNPKEIKTKAKEMTVEYIKQYFIEIPERFKFDTLTNHFDINAPKLEIVFTRTKKRVDEFTEGLKLRDICDEGIHGGLTLCISNSVLNQFKNECIDMIVAKDVVAR